MAAELAPEVSKEELESEPVDVVAKHEGAHAMALGGTIWNRRNTPY